MYKTSVQQRKAALAYYYANKEKVRAYQEQERRARGVLPAKAKMTDAEKLTAVRVCKCGERVTTPSLLLQCSNVCLRCREKSPAAKQRKTRNNRTYRKGPAHLRAQVQAYKKERGCLQCQAHPSARKLHFHHRDPTTKLFKIAWGVYHVAAKVVWAEIAKCDVLCQKCHEEVHEG